MSRSNQPLCSGIKGIMPFNTKDYHKKNFKVIPNSSLAILESTLTHQIIKTYILNLMNHISKVLVCLNH